MNGPGRPRLKPSPSGRGTRADLLEAAAKLFARDGFRASTHAIAEAAGVRQATLYHYFDNREALLLELLLQTVQPTIATAEALTSATAAPQVKLWALSHFDATQLLGGEVNVGALYLLPETAHQAMAEFQVRWQQVRDHYRSLVASCGDGDGTRADLCLGIVESVILIRRRSDGRSPLPDGRAVADAVVQVALGRALTVAEAAAAAELAGA